MDSAVAQLTIVKVSFLGTLTRQLGYTCHCLTFTFTLLNLLHDNFSHIRIPVKIVINLLLDEVTHIFINRRRHRMLGIHLRWYRRHCKRPQFDFRLTLKHRFLHIQCNSCNNTCTYIAIFIVLLEEFLNSLGYMLLEGTLMSTALSCMLSIHKRIVLLTILIGMRKGNFNILTLEMNNGIKCIAGHTVL